MGPVLNSLAMSKSAVFGAVGPGLGVLAVILGIGASSCESPSDPSARPGATIWKTQGKGFGQPAFDASTAFFVGPDHDLTAVDKNTGAVRWRTTTGSSGLTGGYNAVVAGNVVALGDGSIFGIDRSNGAVIWTFAPNGVASPGAWAMATDGSRIFTGSLSGQVFAIDAATGAERWRSAVIGTSQTMVRDPVLSGDLVFVCFKRGQSPSAGGIAALEAATGALRWSREFPQVPPFNEGGCFPNAVVAGNVVAGGTHDGHIHALNIANGEIVWSDARPNNMGLRPLASHGSVIVAGSSDGDIIAFEAADGVKRWTATASFGSVVFPIGIDGKAAYVNHFGQVVAFDLLTGKKLWIAGDNPGTAGEFLYAPAVDSDRLYLGGVTGLYAIRK